MQRAVAVLEAGGLVCYPTDTYYGIGCDLFQKKAIERLALLKRRDPHKPFAFLCADLGDVSRYAIVDNEKFRLLRRILPGPYTVVLPATRVVPRTALTRQRTVGIRVPDAPVAIALVKSLGRPLATTSAGLPGEEPLIDAADIRDHAKFPGEHLLAADGGREQHQESRPQNPPAGAPQGAPRFLPSPCS